MRHQRVFLPGLGVVSCLPNVLVGQLHQEIIPALFRSGTFLWNWLVSFLVVCIPAVGSTVNSRRLGFLQQPSQFFAPPWLAIPA